MYNYYYSEFLLFCFICCWLFSLPLSPQRIYHVYVNNIILLCNNLLPCETGTLAIWMRQFHPFVSHCSTGCRCRCAGCWSASCRCGCTAAITGATTARPRPLRRRIIGGQCTQLFRQIGRWCCDMIAQYIGHCIAASHTARIIEIVLLGGWFVGLVGICVTSRCHCWFFHGRRQDSEHYNIRKKQKYEEIF